MNWPTTSESIHGAFLLNMRDAAMAQLGITPAVFAVPRKNGRPKRGEVEARDRRRLVLFLRRVGVCHKSIAEVTGLTEKEVSNTVSQSSKLKSTPTPEAP